MNKLQTKIMLLVSLGVLALAPGVRADEWTQKTVFTFSGPVEVPGQILPAGTYVFKLANSHSIRNIVQVFSKDEKQVLGTFLAITDYRPQASEKTIIRFEERTAGSPQAIKGWFYPGRTIGHEFVYPKPEAVALANANNTPVPAMPVELTADTTKAVATLHAPEIVALLAAPLMAEEPAGQEAEIAEAFGTPDNQTAALSAGLPEKLPSTASPLPLIGLIGLLSLGLAFTLRLVAGRTK